MKFRSVVWFCVRKIMGLSVGKGFYCKIWIYWNLQANNPTYQKFVGAQSSRVTLTPIPKLCLACIQCSKLVSEADSDHVLIIKCKCSVTSDHLVHDSCKDKWSRIRGDTCSFCPEQIMYKKVKISPDFTQTTGDSSQRPKLSKWNR